MSEELFAAFVRDRYPRPLDHPMLASHQQTGLTRVREMIRRWGGAILADEAGMGKSYIAAALAVEMAREGKKVELIVPASLKDQWKDTLQKFGLSGTVLVSHEALHRRATPSIAKGSTLIIIDEAHRFRNAKTKRYRALSELACGQPVLLVTATPICNRLSDLLSLFRIFAADDIFRQEGIPSITRVFETGDRDALQRVLEETVVRRTPESLPAALKFGSVKRHVVPYRIHRSEEIGACIEKLRFPVVARPSDRHLLKMLMWRRLDSSEAALRESLRRQRRFYRRALEAISEGCHLSKREFFRIFGDSDEDVPVQELMFRSFWFHAGTTTDEELRAIDRELAVIESLLQSLDRSSAWKLDALMNLCAQLSGERLLVFTSAVATARAVYEALREDRRAAFISSRRIFVGRDRCPDASYVFRMFTRGTLDLIVSTDIASEGLNLQAASAVIHYDMPWNPVKLAQRNGRASRIGQREASVRAFYFVSSERNDRRRSLSLIASKSRIVRSFFGSSGNGQLPPFVRSQQSIEAAMHSEPVAVVETPQSLRRSRLVHIREITGAATVERIAASSSGGLCFDWESIEEAIAEGGANAGAETIDAALANHGLSLANRIQLPARIPRDRVVLRRQLEKRGRWDARWCDRLSASYPHGIECAIRAAAEDSTGGTLDQLGRLLDENRMERPRFVRVQLVQRA